jgi:hypothetical protein
VAYVAVLMRPIISDGADGGRRFHDGKAHKTLTLPPYRLYLHQRACAHATPRQKSNYLELPPGMAGASADSSTLRGSCT